MRKLTAAEAGKLGYLASRKTQQQKVQERIDAYLLSPKKCKQCKKILPYDSRQKTFCNRSCAATHNNAKRGSKLVSWTCSNCGTSHTNVKWKIGKFCNNKCQREYEAAKRISEWQEGKGFSKGPVKRYLSEKKKGCWKCGITQWNGEKITLELEHIDGNSTNNKEENLALLCPNCHSQTDTYKGRNRGNGRHVRRTRYAEEKSF